MLKLWTDGPSEWSVPLHQKSIEIYSRCWSRDWMGHSNWVFPCTKINKKLTEKMFPSLLINKDPSRCWAIKISNASIKPLPFYKYVNCSTVFKQQNITLYHFYFSSQEYYVYKDNIFFKVAVLYFRIIHRRTVDSPLTLCTWN